MIFLSWKKSGIIKQGNYGYSVINRSTVHRVLIPTLENFALIKAVLGSCLLWHQDCWLRKHWEEILYALCMKFCLKSYCFLLYMNVIPAVVNWSLMYLVMLAGLQDQRNLGLAIRAQNVHYGWKWYYTVFQCWIFSSWTGLM